MAKHNPTQATSVWQKAQAYLPQNQENLEKHNAYLMQLINMKGQEKKITFATWLE